MHPNVMRRRHRRAAALALGGRERAGPGPGLHQCADRRHLRRLLSARRGSLQDLHRQGPGQPPVGAGDQGVGGKPHPPAAGQGRDRASRSATASLSAGPATRRPASRRKLDKLRGIAAIYPNYIQIVATKESGIKTLADLKGKRLSVGAPKSGTELNARAILQGAGLTYKDLGKVEYLPFGESVELMKNRQLDATLQSAGLGVSSIRDLATSVPIVVVEIPADRRGQGRLALREGDDPGQHL